MKEFEKAGIITIFKELITDFQVMVKDVEPYLHGAALDPEGVKQHLDDLLDKMTVLNEKISLTHDLVKGVISSIHASRSELKQTVDGLIQQTGDQLKKITATTEDATHKILDVASKLDEDQNVIISKLKEIVKADHSDEVRKVIDEIQEMVYNNQNAAFDIIQFLQFQDITAQQIAGAYSLLADTEKTLVYVLHLMKEFDFGGNNPADLLPKIDKNAFNADAVFGDKGDIQHVIDDLFLTGDTNQKIPEDKQRQSDIASSSNSNANNDDDFDIDALFNN
ncbi:MAG: hypothetical protein FWG20_03785 [Candidatus Cloacimonetes bacterium]|nr:hypothetical protein [Candidatus Cloacimonadota bacterium]